MTISQAGVQSIPGIPEQAQARLIQLLTSNPELQAVWLFGSRAMGRHQQGSDIDLCLEAHVQRVGRCLWRKACRPSVNA
ncbi:MULTISPECIES: nucleotidyltransferase domain-containing protein [unclassified Cyanobium]|uniref:nucleotidyltransferase domain-containing protein n=1 Tax=unclassified Cyanobium TaxID=2627006 RepID=UPI0020CD2E33|nr:MULTISPECIES: nucleotidyltransferase domain-containing protein [unclassified Cyanobium]